MLTFNEKVGKKYQEFINGNYKVIGSFRSNRFKIHKKKKKLTFYSFPTGGLI